MAKQPTKKDKIIFISLALTATLFGFMGLFKIYDDIVNSYRPAKNWLAYQSHNINFKYPEEWDVDFCGRQNNDIFRLPKSITGSVLGSSGEMIIKGYKQYNKETCENGKMVIKTNQSVCSNKATGRDIIRTENGRFIDLNGESGISTIYIQTDLCSSLFTFYITPADGVYISQEDVIKYGTPGVERSDLVNSPQFKDIVKFAESIQIKN